LGAISSRQKVEKRLTLVKEVWWFKSVEMGFWYQDPYQPLQHVAYNCWIPHSKNPCGKELAWISNYTSNLFQVDKAVITSIPSSDDVGSKSRNEKRSA